MSKYFIKNNVRGVTPDYEKSRVDFSHQQQQRHGSFYQKVLLGHCSGMLGIARNTTNFRSK